MEYFFSSSSLSIVMIRDSRSIKDFKTKTYSDFKKIDVLRELHKSIKTTRIENVYFWLSELMCSGHFYDIWVAFIQHYSTYIYSANPKFPIYLEKRLVEFRKIMNMSASKDELEFRNDNRVRDIIAEISAILCYSQRRHSIDTVKIDNTYFDLHVIRLHLLAPSTKYADGIFRTDDAKEVYMAVNELAYCLSDGVRNMMKATFWIEWIIEFEVRARKQKVTCSVVKRDFVDVASNCETNVIWIVWDVLIQEASRRSVNVLQCIRALCNLFSFRYTSVNNKRFRYLLYNACIFLCEVPDMHIPLVGNTGTIKEMIPKFVGFFGEKKVQPREMKPVEKTREEKLSQKMELWKSAMK